MKDSLKPGSVKALDENGENIQEDPLVLRAEDLDPIASGFIRGAMKGAAEAGIETEAMVISDLADRRNKAIFEHAIEQASPNGFILGADVILNKALGGASPWNNSAELNRMTRALNVMEQMRGGTVAAAMKNAIVEFRACKSRLKIDQVHPDLIDLLIRSGWIPSKMDLTHIEIGGRGKYYSLVPDILFGQRSEWRSMDKAAFGMTSKTFLNLVLAMLGKNAKKGSGGNMRASSRQDQRILNSGMPNADMPNAG